MLYNSPSHAACLQESIHWTEGDHTRGTWRDVHPHSCLTTDRTYTMDVFTHISKKGWNYVAGVFNPWGLNKAIVRESNKVQTLDGISHNLKVVKPFNKMEGAKTEFCSIYLDEPLRLLMVFNTHLGTYKFNYMPFSLYVSQDVFQIRMDQITECCRGIIAIHDDIVVYGKTEQEYDGNLKQLVTSTQNGPVFNNKMCDIKKESVHFFGCVFTSDGMASDPWGIQPHRHVTTYGHEGLQSFPRLLNFMQPFLCEWSHHTAPFWEARAKTKYSTGMKPTT